MVSDTDGKVCLTMRCGNKMVKVTLEFPEQSDLTNEQEFVSRLKMLYLGKKENMDYE